VTGPEHFKAAEELVSDAAEEPAGSDQELYFIGAAQVHASLAHTAAVVDMALGLNIPEWAAITNAKRSPR
jgi:hypothetical protein